MNKFLRFHNIILMSDQNNNQQNQEENKNNENNGGESNFLSYKKINIKIIKRKIYFQLEFFSL